MTRQELAALPKGTKLFLVTRKVSRSNMRQVSDVFYLEMCDCKRCAVCDGQTICAKCEMCTRCHSHKLNCPGCHGTEEMRLRWIRISGQEQREFNKRFGVHACGSVDEDRRVGGSFYVNGCGFSRSDALVEALSIWAANDPKYFTCEVL